MVFHQKLETLLVDNIFNSLIRLKHTVFKKVVYLSNWYTSTQMRSHDFR